MNQEKHSVAAGIWLQATLQIYGAAWPVPMNTNEGSVRTEEPFCRFFVPNTSRFTFEQLGRPVTPTSGHYGGQMCDVVTHSLCRNLYPYWDFHNVALKLYIIHSPHKYDIVYFNMVFTLCNFAYLNILQLSFQSVLVLPCLNGWQQPGHLAHPVQ